MKAMIPFSEDWINKAQTLLYIYIYPWSENKMWQSVRDTVNLKKGKLSLLFEIELFDHLTVCKQKTDV